MEAIIDYTLLQEYEFMGAKELFRQKMHHEYNKSKEYFSTYKHTMTIPETLEYRDSMEQMRSRMNDFDKWYEFNADYLIILNN